MLTKSIEQKISIYIFYLLEKEKKNEGNDIFHHCCFKEKDKEKNIESIGKRDAKSK